MLEEKNNSAPLANINPALFIILSLGVIFVTYQIFGGIISYALTGPDMGSKIKDIKYFRIIISFSQFMLILVPVIVLNLLRGDNSQNTFRLNKPDYKIFIISIIGILVIQPFLQFYIVLQNKIIFSLPFGTDFLNKIKEFFDLLEAMVMEVVKSHSRVEFMTVVFVIAVTPAICEEFLFRGLILTNLLKFLRPVLAIIFTGLIFALFHFDPFNLVPLIILGIYITIASYASNSIYTAIVLHFINNFISAMGVYVLGEEFTSSTKNVSPEEFQQLLLWGVISAILFVIILISVRKLYKSKNIISI